MLECFPGSPVHRNGVHERRNVEGSPHSREEVCRVEVPLLLSMHSAGTGISTRPGYRSQVDKIHF